MSSCQIHWLQMDLLYQNQIYTSTCLYSKDSLLPHGIVFVDCNLQQSLYGLKQGPRAWFEKTQQTLQLDGFQQSKYDLSFVFRHTSHGIT